MGNDDYRRDSGDNISTRLTYLLIGGGIGAVIALLFAPKSGQELRGDIADATRKGIDSSREAAQQLGERAGEYYQTGRERAAEYSKRRETSFRALYTGCRKSWRSGANSSRNSVAPNQHRGGSDRRRQEGLSGREAKTEMSGRIEAAPNYDEKAN